MLAESSIYVCVGLVTLRLHVKGRCAVLRPKRKRNVDAEYAPDRSHPVYLKFRCNDFEFGVRKFRVLVCSVVYPLIFAWVSFSDDQQQTRAFGEYRLYYQFGLGAVDFRIRWRVSFYRARGSRNGNRKCVLASVPLPFCVSGAFEKNVRGGRALSAEAAVGSVPISKSPVMSKWFSGCFWILLVAVRVKGREIWLVNCRVSVCWDCVTETSDFWLWIHYNLLQRYLNYLIYNYYRFCKY